MRKGYIYRFIDKNNNVIYVGKTVSMKSRMAQHFTKGHLSKECYDNVCKIEFIEVNDEVTALMLEVGYINLHKPQFNKDAKTRSLVNRDIQKQLSNYNWKEYKCVYTDNKTIDYKTDKQRKLVAASFQVAVMIMLVFYLIKVI